MNCKGMHCEGCGHERRRGRRGRRHRPGGDHRAGAAEAWPAIISAVEIAAWTVAGITGAVIVATGGVLATRAVRGRARRAAGAARW